MAAVGVGGFFQHIGQRGLLLAGSGGAFSVLGRDVVIGHLQAHALGQILNRFDETHARVVHQKADGVAVLAAAKAVVELLGGAHAERGRLFPVKGAQPHEVGAPFFELHIAAHDIDHVDAREQLLDERLGDRHARIFPHGWPRQSGYKPKTRPLLPGAPPRGFSAPCQPGAL